MAVKVQLNIVLNKKSKVHCSIFLVAVKPYLFFILYNVNPIRIPQLYGYIAYFAS